MPDTTQNVNASITYVDDWSNRLAKAYPGSTVTIASAVGSVTGGAVISAVNTSATSISFHLVTAAVTPSTNVVVTLTPTLSNGDTDPITIEVGVTA